MRHKPIYPVRAAELAWLLIEICRVGHEVAGAGWCLGELRGNQVGWRDAKLVRVPDRHLLAKIRSSRLQNSHRRRGHDESCRLFGVPRAALLRVLQFWGDEQAVSLLDDVFDEAIIELQHYEYAASRIDLLTHLVGRRITVSVPADQVTRRG